MNGHPYRPTLPLSQIESQVLAEVRKLRGRGIGLDQAIEITAGTHAVKPIHVERLVAFVIGVAPELYDSEGSQR